MNATVKKIVLKGIDVFLVFLLVFFGFLIGYRWGKLEPLNEYNYCHPWLEQYSGTTHKLTDRIDESQIQVFRDQVIISGEYSWASYSNTDSMLPLIDGHSNGLYVKIDSSTDLRIGDVISFRPEGYSDLFVHRIVNIGVDEKGIWYQTKGDNAKFNDPFLVRRGDMVALLVGVLW